MAVRKNPRGPGWIVISEQGQVLRGPFATRAEAEEALKEIEMFKHMGRRNGRA